MTNTEFAKSIFNSEIEINNEQRIVSDFISFEKLLDSVDLTFDEDTCEATNDDINNYLSGLAASIEADIELGLK